MNIVVLLLALAKTIKPLGGGACCFKYGSILENFLDENYSERIKYITDKVIGIVKKTKKASENFSSAEEKDSDDEMYANWYYDAKGDNASSYRDKIFVLDHEKKSERQVVLNKLKTKFKELYQQALNSDDVELKKNLKALKLL